MPLRGLRPSITQSKRWNRCSYFTQTFWVRLVTLVDDYGRFEADPELLRSLAFPYGDPEGKEVPVRSIADSCQQMSACGLLKLYEFEDKQYLQLLKWKERIRSDSKFPDPECCQMTANDSKCRPPTPTFPPTPTVAEQSPHRRNGSHGNPNMPSIRFQPVKSGLYPREYKEMMDTVDAEIEKIKKDPRSYDRALTKEAKDLVAMLEKDGKKDRAKEILERKDSYLQTAMKPSAVADLRAWKNRRSEILAAMNGVVTSERAFT